MEVVHSIVKLSPSFAAGTLVACCVLAVTVHNLLVEFCFILTIAKISMLKLVHKMTNC